MISEATSIQTFAVWGGHVGRTFEDPQIPRCLWGCLVELVIRGEGLHFLGERANVMVSALFTGFLLRRPTLLWQSSFQRSYAVSH